VIDFEDDLFDGDFTDEDYYFEGLDVTATFSGDEWWGWDGDEAHSGDFVGQSAEDGTIEFDQDVIVPSLWLMNMTDDQIHVEGSLDGSMVWEFTNDGDEEEWVECTAGDGEVIDTLTFTDCGDQDIDDITVELP
jgi:hypothetical protein